MAQLTVQEFSNVGINPTFVAAGAAGDKFANMGTTYLFVKNGGAGSINVTVNSVRQCNHGFDHDLVQAVAAGATVKIGPLATNRFNDDQGNVGVTYSGTTTVTVAALRI